MRGVVEEIGEELNSKGWEAGFYAGKFKRRNSEKENQAKRSSDGISRAFQDNK